MALDGCSQLCKCILILVNIALGLLGTAMLGLGLWLRTSSSTSGFFNIDLNTAQFVIGVTVLMVLGTLMLMISIFGTFGTCNENKTSLGIFSCLLIVLAVIEIASGILFFLKREEVGVHLAEFYATIYAQNANKGGDTSMTVTLNLFHNTFSCCGILGEAVESLAGLSCSSGGRLKTIVKLVSSISNGASILPCPLVIQDTMMSKGAIVLGGFLGAAALTIVALVCCGILLMAIKNSQAGYPVAYSHSTGIY